MNPSFVSIIETADDLVHVITPIGSADRPLNGYKYAQKAVRNESVKGSDLLGFRFTQSGKISQTDELVIFEVKAQLGVGEVSRLGDAIVDSAKDVTRKVEALNALKQRFIDLNQSAEAKRVERFQDELDRPYTEQYGAAAVISSSTIKASDAKALTCAGHPKSANLSLVVVRGADLMTLAHELYRRAAHEA